MNKLICNNCGSIELVLDNNYATCPYCGTRFIITKEEHRGIAYGTKGHLTLSHSDVDSSIALDDDITRLLRKCQLEPRNAKKYAKLVLDIDPDNEDALKYIKR